MGGEGSGGGGEGDTVAFGLTVIVTPAATHNTLKLM